jgi:hypothetical protein
MGMGDRVPPPAQVLNAPTIPRPGTPPSPGSFQKPGQTWDELFKARDELWAGRVESEKDRQRRQNRERQPPRKKANWFEWRKNSAGIFVRHHLTRGEAEEAFGFYKQPNQIRYHARSNQWDFADDFNSYSMGHDSAMPSRPKISDYDDDEFFEEEHHTQPWVTTMRSAASTSSKLQGDLEDGEVVEGMVS